jgi:hypothetical protein
MCSINACTEIHSTQFHTCTTRKAKDFFLLPFTNLTMFLLVIPYEDDNKCNYNYDDRCNEDVKTNPKYNLKKNSKAIMIP